MKTNIILTLLAVTIVGAPLWLLRGKGHDFAGADSKAQAAITDNNPGYKPWFSSIWRPPSQEVETLLFALQAAIGSGVLCYYFGYTRGRAQGRRTKSQGEDNAPTS